MKVVKNREDIDQNNLKSLKLITDNNHKSRKFEDLEIWKLSQELYLDLYKTFTTPKYKDYFFRDQILRAGLSISNNIAEGHERQSNKELSKFLYYSKGSCGEVRNMIHIAGKQSLIDENKLQQYIDKCTTISVKIHNLIKYLNKK